MGILIVRLFTVHCGFVGIDKVLVLWRDFETSKPDMHIWSVLWWSEWLASLLLTIQRGRAWCLKPLFSEDCVGRSLSDPRCFLNAQISSLYTWVSTCLQLDASGSYVRVEATPGHIEHWANVINAQWWLPICEHVCASRQYTLCTCASANA